MQKMTGTASPLVDVLRYLFIIECVKYLTHNYLFNFFHIYSSIHGVPVCFKSVVFLG